jgi:hypothetical protein
MTDNYTHFDPLEFTEVNKIQEMLLTPKEEKPKTQRTIGSHPALTIVKMPEAETERRRKVS